MEILKTEYEIKKDGDFIGERHETYTISKIFTYSNGETETRFKTWVPDIDGDINNVDLNTLDFPKPITTEEWEQLPKEYRTAWIKGNMTKELSEQGLKILKQIRERKMKEVNV